MAGARLHDPAGVLTNCDRWAFEVLVCLMAKFRKGQAKVGELSQILNLLARMGLTPADRNRVAVTPSQSNKESPWDPVHGTETALVKPHVYPRKSELAVVAMAIEDLVEGLILPGSVDILRQFVACYRR